MTRVFISYRRADCPHAAGRLRDYLLARLGEVNVFFDVNSVRPGEDFQLRIETTLQQCDFVLVMIGGNWNPVSADGDRQELDDPNDWIRIEVARALASSRKVIPVLVDGTMMPESAALPDDVAPLTRLNAVPLRSGADFSRDSQQILEAIGGRPRGRRALVAALSFAALLVLSGIVLKLAPWQRPTMLERVMEGMAHPDTPVDEPDFITHEGMVGEKYGIINDKPWRRKALVVSDQSRRFYQPRVALSESQIYVLYLAKSDRENTIYLYELAMGSSEPRLIDQVPYHFGSGYYFDSDSNLAIRGEFVYYYGTWGAQGRRYRIGSGEKAGPADFYPQADARRDTSVSPNGRYIVASNAGGLSTDGSRDYKLATRGQNDSGEFTGISMYDRKTDSNTVLFKQKYTGEWSIGQIIWADDSEQLFFDNAGAVACVWKYTLNSRILQKIVPEHEARSPVFFRLSEHEFIVYAITIGEDWTAKSQVMIATE